MSPTDFVQVNDQKTKRVNLKSLPLTGAQTARGLGLSEGYGLALAAFAVWRVDMCLIRVPGSGQTTKDISQGQGLMCPLLFDLPSKIASKSVKYHGQMLPECEHI